MNMVMTHKIPLMVTIIRFYLLIFSLMTTEVIVHASEFSNEIDFIRYEVDKALIGKLDVYIKKYVKEDDKLRLELTVTRTKKGITGKLDLSFPGGAFRSQREDFEKLDDLVSHLFSHIKEQMAK